MLAVQGSNTKGGLLQEAVASLLQVSNTLQASASQTASGSRCDRSQSSQKQALQAAMPNTAAEAFLQCIEHVCSPAVAGAVGRATAVGLLQDVATVVKHGRSVVVLALYDLQRLVIASQDRCAHSGMPTAVVPASATQLSMAEQRAHMQSQTQTPCTSRAKTSAAKARTRGVLQKLHFLLSWANELSGTSYADMVQAVTVELEHHNSTLYVLEKQSDLLISDPFVKSTMQQQVSSPQYPVIQEL